MQHVPTSEEKSWLVSRLAELIAKQGAAQFVSMPLVEPTPEFFPDLWSFSHRGLDRLVRRLMQYAGLSGLEVELDTYDGLEYSDSTEHERRIRSSAALFWGIVDGRCRFGFNTQAPPDAEYMAGVMAHETAHAYRAHHKLSASTSEEEEELLTDLTAVYLGFGILTTNISYRFRTSGRMEGQSARHRWSTQAAGYLPPQAFAYLLAIQMTARNLGWDDRGLLLKHLEPNQEAFTKSALEEVREHRTEIMGTLHLETETDTDESAELSDILQPLPEYEATEAEPSAAPKTPEPFNLGWPVFRVPENHAHRYAVYGAFAGALVGGIAAAVFRHLAPGLVGMAVGTVFGFLRGRRVRFEICSDPQCRTVLGAQETCPYCGGIIAGTIRDVGERLEAAEEWERRTKREERTRRKVLKAEGATSEQADPTKLSNSSP